MDDRNLVAVAEQAAATSRVRPGGHFAGCTVKSDDGRVFRGCVLEYQDPALDQDPIANAIASARSDGVRKIVRIELNKNFGHWSRLALSGTGSGVGAGSRFIKTRLCL